MLRSHIRTDGLTADFCDGSLVKSLPLFQSHPTSLQLIAYFDEVEVCDPLAARSGIHKLGNTNNYHCHSYMYKRDCLYMCTGLFYYILGNLRPELQSTHRAIQLIACVTTSNLKKYGFQDVLQPFINDVNILSQVTNLGLPIFFLHNTVAAER